MTTLKIFFLFIIFFLNQSKLIKENNSNNIRLKNQNSKRINRIRKLQEDSGDHSAANNVSFVPLSIYLDYAEFEETIPDDLKPYRTNFITGLENAKKILEENLEMLIDLVTSTSFDEGRISGWDIENWNFDYSKEINFTEYNYFIHPYFKDMEREFNSLIVDEFAHVPLVGLVIINTIIEDKSKLTDEYLTTRMLHHFIHLLGFHQNIEGIYDFSPIQIDDDDDVRKYFLTEETSPNFFNYTRKYFNCSDISKIYMDIDEEVENYEFDDELINIYFPKRYFLGELMTRFDYPEEQILSGFTWAFLDDIPYLRVVKNYTGGLMKFGKNKGCEFFFSTCGNISANPITFANEFYIPKSPDQNPDNSCSSGRLSKTIYKLTDITDEEISDEDKKFNMEFILDHRTGIDNVNYCPIGQYDTDANNYIYAGRCSDSENTYQNLIRDEELGPHSFCVISSLERISININGVEPTLESLCYEMICSERSLTIRIKDDYIVCPREGGKIKAKGFNGFILCPDYNLICSSSKMCNNLLDCIKLGSEELNESFIYDYEIKTTQNSEVYNKDNITFGWEETYNGTCPYLCMQCNLTDCIRCAPRYKYINNECVYGIPYCIGYENDEIDENDICNRCDSEHILVEDKNGIRYCEDESKKNEYYLINNELKLYKKCSDSIDKCYQCTYDSADTIPVKCSECYNNERYKPIDIGLICGDLETKLYYLDINNNKYKKCTEYGSYHNCKKCEITGTDNKFNCLECSEDAAFAYDDEVNAPNCKIKNTLVEEKIYFKKSDNNYYKCEYFNKIQNCKKCDNENICIECLDSYTTANGGTKCILTSDITVEKLYYEDPINSNYYYPCGNSITNCLTCESKTDCKGCITPSYFLAQDNNDNKYCEDSTKINLYYYKTELSLYKKCEDSISHCISCELNSVNLNVICNGCENGFEIIDEGELCGDLSTKRYYKENNNKYYSCINYSTMTNCLLCEKNSEKFTCLECNDNYVLFHNDIDTCIDKNSVDNTMYKLTDNKNYYSCQNIKYNNVEHCSSCIKKEECSECLSGYTITNGNTLCILTSDIDAKKYYIDPDNNNYYYPCQISLSNCLNCDSKTKCLICDTPNYLLEESDKCIAKTQVDAKFYYEDPSSHKYIKCSNKIEKCEKCNSDTDCISCETNFYLVEDDNGQVSCQNIDISKYYQKNSADNSKLFYKLCSNEISHCDECSSSAHCNKCDQGFAIINNIYNECKDLSTKKYYYDSELRSYQLCSNKFELCEKCDMENGNFTCLQCINNYALKHDDNIICDLITNLDTNVNYYTNDSKISYYSCSLYDEVKNCLECSNNSTCDKCKTGYTMYNINKLCVLPEQKESHYLKDKTGFLIPCYDVVDNCEICNNSNICFICQEESVLLNNNTCIEKELIENNDYFYKDEINNIYTSCSILNNCIKCTSNTICTYCDEGYKVNENNLCQKIILDDNSDDNGLSTGVIIGIVFGCLGFLLFVALTGYYLYKKFYNKREPKIGESIDNKIETELKNDEKIDVNNFGKENDEKIEEKFEKNNVIIHTTRRSIHNIKKNNQ